MLLVSEETTQAGPVQVVDLVVIEIEEDRVSVDIGFDGSKTAVLHCTATLIADLGVLYEYVDVELQKADPDRVHLVIEDSSFRLTPQDPVKEFTVNISVDPGTSSTLHPLVTIDGEARPDFGPAQGVAEDSATIDILPYYGSIMDHDLADGYINIRKGDTGSFQLTIENIGNIGEHFVLVALDSSTLSGKGISVKFEEARVFIAEGSTKNVEVEVKVSTDGERGSYQVKFECYPESVGPGTEEQTSITFQVDVKGIGDDIEEIFDEPWKLIAALVGIVVLLILAGYGIYRLKQHLAWKRTLRRVREAGSERASQNEEIHFSVEEIDR